MKTFEAIYERRSIRMLEKGKQIPEDVMGKILDSARWAPLTPDGIIPYKFIVAREEGTKRFCADTAEELARAGFGGLYEVFAAHLWYMRPDTKLRVTEYTTSGELWRYPEDADVVVIPMAARGVVTGFSALLADPLLQAPYGGMAAENMWLMAHRYGIGAAYNGMPFLDGRRRELMADYLGFPMTWEPVGAFCFGYGSGPRISGPPRGPLEAVAFDEVWGRGWERQAFVREEDLSQTPDIELEDAIKGLKPMKSFNPGALERWMIEKVIDAAIWGPNPENTKHWRWLVIRDEASKDFIYRIVREMRHYGTFHSPEVQFERFWYVKPEEKLQKIEESMEYGEWYQQADTLIVVISSAFNWLEHPGFTTAIVAPTPVFQVATGCCAQNLMLAATTLGLGVNYDPMPVSDPRTKEMFHEYFGIPQSWLPIGIISLGKPGEPMEQPPRPELEALMFNESWGNPYKGKKFSI